MTAQVTYPDSGIIPEWALSAPVQDEQEDIGHTPGTLWERVADRSAKSHRVDALSALREFEEKATHYLAAGSALARAKAAHPAGKGITHEEVQQ